MGINAISAITSSIVAGISNYVDQALNTQDNQSQQANQAAQNQQAQQTQNVQQTQSSSSSNNQTSSQQTTSQQPSGTDVFGRLGSFFSSIKEDIGDVVEAIDDSLGEVKQRFTPTTQDRDGGFFQSITSNSAFKSISRSISNAFESSKSSFGDFFENIEASAKRTAAQDLARVTRRLDVVSASVSGERASFVFETPGGESLTFQSRSGLFGLGRTDFRLVGAPPELSVGGNEVTANNLRYVASAGRFRFDVSASDLVLEGNARITVSTRDFETFTTGTLKVDTFEGGFSQYQKTTFSADSSTTQNYIGLPGGGRVEATLTDGVLSAQDVDVTIGGETLTFSNISIDTETGEFTGSVDAGQFVSGLADAGQSLTFTVDAEGNFAFVEDQAFIDTVNTLTTDDQLGELYSGILGALDPENRPTGSEALTYINLALDFQSVASTSAQTGGVLSRFKASPLLQNLDEAGRLGKVSSKAGKALGAVGLVFAAADFAFSLKAASDAGFDDPEANKALAFSTGYLVLGALAFTPAAPAALAGTAILLGLQYADEAGLIDLNAAGAEISEFASNVGDAVSQGISDFGNELEAFGEGTAAALQQGVSNTVAGVENVINQGGTLIIEAGTDIVNFGGQLASGAFNTAVDFGNEFISVTEDVGNAVIEGGTEFIEGTGEFIGDVGQAGGEFIEDVGDAGGQFVEDVGDAGGQFIEGTGEVLGDIGEGGAQLIDDIVHIQPEDVINIFGSIAQSGDDGDKKFLGLF